MERLDFNLLFRWFVGLVDGRCGLGRLDVLEEPGPAAGGRGRGEVPGPLLALPKVKRLLSSDHFSVDGTLIEAWASIKSFRPKDGSDETPRRRSQRGAQLPPGEAFKRDASEHDRPRRAALPQGRRSAGRLCYMGHVLMENRHGLAVGGGVSQATGTAEREAALDLIDGHRRRGGRITLGADKAYDVSSSCTTCEIDRLLPHIAIDGHLTKTGKRRKTAIDERTTRHVGYDISQRCRKRIEEVFGWIKSSAGLAKVKLRGRDRVDAAFTLALAAYNLIRLPKLLGAAA